MESMLVIVLVVNTPTFGSSAALISDHLLGVNQIPLVVDLVASIPKLLPTHLPPQKTYCNNHGFSVFFGSFLDLSPHALHVRMTFDVSTIFR